MKKYHPLKFFRKLSLDIPGVAILAAALTSPGVAPAADGKPGAKNLVAIASILGRHVGEAEAAHAGSEEKDKSLYPKVYHANWRMCQITQALAMAPDEYFVPSARMNHETFLAFESGISRVSQASGQDGVLSGRLRQETPGHCADIEVQIPPAYMNAKKYGPGALGKADLNLLSDPDAIQEAAVLEADHLPDAGAGRSRDAERPARADLDYSDIVARFAPSDERSVDDRELNPIDGVGPNQPRGKRVNTLKDVMEARRQAIIRAHVSGPDEN